MMDKLVSSEYMIIAGIALMILNMFLSVLRLFLQHDAIYQSGKVKVISNIFLLLLETNRSEDHYILFFEIGKIELCYLL